MLGQPPLGGAGIALRAPQGPVGAAANVQAGAGGLDLRLGLGGLAARAAGEEERQRRPACERGQAPGAGAGEPVPEGQRRWHKRHQVASPAQRRRRSRATQRAASAIAPARARATIWAAPSRAESAVAPLPAAAAIWAVEACSVVG